MKKEYQINTLFLDVGGVLLSDGWDRNSRKAGAKTFSLDLHDMEERHHLNFETYELGKMSLDEYLESVIFYKDQNFTTDEFKTFIYEQSRSQPEMPGLNESINGVILFDETIRQQKKDGTFFIKVLVDAGIITGSR